MIEGIRNFDNFSASLRNFTRFAGVSGACDLDFCYLSPKGNIFIMEGKNVRPEHTFIEMPTAQYNLLIQFARKGCKVLIVGEKENETYHIFANKLLIKNLPSEFGYVHIPLGLCDRNTRSGFEKWLAITVNNPDF